MTATELADIERVCFTNLEMGAPISYSECGRILADKDYIVKCVKMDGKICGVAIFLTVMDVVDVISVAVLPDYSRRGIGRELMLLAIDEALARDAKKVMLEVSEKNFAAIGLYKALGFGQIAVRKDYYGAGIDALVFTLLLK